MGDSGGGKFGVEGLQGQLAQQAKKDYRKTGGGLVCTLIPPQIGKIRA